MSAAKAKPGTVSEREPGVIEPRVTLDDLRHRAEDVKTKAVAEAKGAVDVVMGESSVKTLLVVAGVVVVAASIAFYLGSRAARAAALDELLGE